MTRALLAALLVPLAALAQDDVVLRHRITPAFPDTLTSEAYYALSDKAAFSGVVADRHPNGRLKLLHSVVDGRAVGLWTEWYPSGIVRYVGQWVPGEGGGRAGGEGVWLYFHQNGRVRYREVYRADRAHGPSEQWHANSQKAVEGRFRDGARVSRWRWWNEAGGLDSTRVYPAAHGAGGSETGWRPDPDGGTRPSAPGPATPDGLGAYVAAREADAPRSIVAPRFALEVGTSASRTRPRGRTSAVRPRGRGSDLEDGPSWRRRATPCAAGRTG